MRQVTTSQWPNTTWINLPETQNDFLYNCHYAVGIVQRLGCLACTPSRFALQHHMVSVHQWVQPWDLCHWWGGLSNSNTMEPEQHSVLWALQWTSSQLAENLCWDPRFLKHCLGTFKTAITRDRAQWPEHVLGMQEAWAYSLAPHTSLSTAAEHLPPLAQSRE